MICPHIQVSMPVRLHPKLFVRYCGPYLVIRQVGALAFQLQLLEFAHIHPVFYVSQLNLAVGDNPIEQELPTELQDSRPTLQPDQILGTRTVTQPGESIQQVLIQWQQHPPEEVA